jgi:DNA-binding winged helix-turn-helix (wHTH) protein
VHDRRRFGRFEIRPAERLLVVDGRPASLGARAFDLLLALVARRERVVRKGELLDAVWPGMVVEENNLAVQVSALRKVLGPGVIATIPGRGYRFVATETPADADPAPAANTARAPSPAADATVAASVAVSAVAVAEAPSAPGAARQPVSIAAPPALVGRDDDLAALAALWPRARCITVVGAGGIGKTTLARAAAHARQGAPRDGIAWVDLADTTPGAGVNAAIAQALRVDAVEGADPLPALLGALAPLELLLVLDNAEHVIEPVARIARAVLAGAPGVQLLVTS